MHPYEDLAKSGYNPDNIMYTFLNQVSNTPLKLSFKFFNSPG